MTMMTMTMTMMMSGDTGNDDVGISLPSGNPGCRCATHQLPGYGAVELKFLNVTLSVFEDCPDHGAFIKKMMRDMLASFSVRVSKSEQ
jgi:hypothetical protein